MRPVKLLLDENVGKRTSDALRDQGLDVVFVGDEKRGAKDEVIIDETKEKDRIIITCDKDFGFLALLHRPPGVVILRLKDERTNVKLKVIMGLVKALGERIYGKLVIAYEDRLRIREL